MRNRLISAGFAVLFLALVLAIAGVGQWGLHAMKGLYADARSIAETQWIDVQIANRALDYSNQNSQINMRVFLGSNPSDKAPLLRLRGENSAKITELLALLQTRVGSDQEQKRLNTIIAARTSYIDSYQQATRFLLAGEQDRARRWLSEDTLSKLVKYHLAFHEFAEFQTGEMNQALENSTVRYAKARKTTVFLIAVIVLLAGGLAGFVIWKIMSEVQRRQRAEDNLRKINRELEFKVLERTADLERKNLDLSAEITERQRSEDLVRRLSAAVEQCPVSVIMTDLSGTMFYVNRKFLEVTGYDLGEVIGQNPSILKSGRQSAEEYKRLWDTILAGNKWSGEFCNRRKNGELYWEHAVIQPIRDDQGNNKYFLAVKEDITLRKRVEAEREKAKDDAEAASRAKSEFLANMSHEIRTPMNGIIGMTELLLETHLSGDQYECLGMVKSSADALLAVINDILDFSKIEAGRLELDPIEFGLRNSVDDTAATVAFKAQQKDLELITDIDPGIPEILIGDPLRLRQVLLNLLGNAIKFTEQGEIVLRVRLKEKTGRGLLLQFSVQDTGIGIPANRQHEIFEAFTQADSSTTRKYAGTGLGLTISSRLARLMGGNIRVESEPGQGSTFYFTAEFGIGKALTDFVNPQDTVDLRNFSVMVVDDNATNRQILRQVLLNWEMKPTVVDSAREALSLLQDAQKSGKPFPLVISDVHMPEMDGFTLAKQIKENPALAGATIMMLSSGERLGDGERCRDLGLNAYLTKPVRQSRLRDAIVAALRGAAAPLSQDVTVTRRSMDETRRCLRVLVAEDNHVNQVLAKRLLEQRGHTVVTANNGVEAVAQVETSEFDVVLMDVQMPEMDGFQATHAIREKEQKTGKHIPIIALTAHAMKGDQERCIAAGLDGYVSKPLQITELLQAIEKATGNQGCETVPQLSKG